MKIRITGILTIIVLLTGGLQSCKSSASETSETGQTIKLNYAENLRMEEFDGYTRVTMRNPWDTTKILQRLVLLEEGSETPEVASDETIITIPLSKSVVFSSIHNSLVGELGKEEAVVGICDVPYIKEKIVLDRIKEGDLEDCGSSMNPNVEKILNLEPDAVLLSPYETGGMEGKFVKAGISVVECPDYMERTPLGRAEWVKFFSRLYGEKERGDSIFGETEQRYNSIKEIAQRAENRPKVLFDTMYGGTWSLPAGQSTIGRLIEDAGGINPYGNVKTAGSVSLSGEKVLMEAGDADIWLIRHAGNSLSADDLLREKALYGEFKAFKTGNVYFSDTTTSGIFEDFAFHPDYLLANLTYLFHPHLSIGGKRYFEGIR